MMRISEHCFIENTCRSHCLGFVFDSNAPRSNIVPQQVSAGYGTAFNVVVAPALWTSFTNRDQLWMTIWPRLGIARGRLDKRNSKFYNKMNNIIVPVDFSEQSEFALKAAADLAHRYGSEILALHMLELNQALATSPEGLYPEQTIFLIKLAEKRFTEFLDKPYLKGVKVTPIIKHYKVYEEVNEIAEKHGASLVIMGSHGTDGLEEVFIGSNAERMVRHSRIPVLVIKSEITDFKIERFVFASSFREDNAMAFNKAKEFATLLSSKLDLVYVNTPGEEFMSTNDINERVGTFLKKVGEGLEVTIYNDYSVERGILNYSDLVKADIIGISTHGRKGLAHFFSGSIGEDVANHSKIPVVTFRI